MVLPLTRSIEHTPTTILTLKRDKARSGTAGAIIGRLFLDNEFECYTLEDEMTLIPIGVYNVILYDSPKNGYIVPLIQVPGRTGIEIHKGNFWYESQGCILVGISHTDTSVVGSNRAFKHLIKSLTLPVVLVIY